MNSQAKPPRRLFAFRAGAQLRGRYGIGADVRDSGPGPSHRPKLLSIRRGTRSPIDFGASGRMLPGRSFRDTRKVAPLHPFQPAIVPAVRSFDSRFAFRYAQAFRVELPCVRRFFLAKRSVASNKNLDFSKTGKIYSGMTAFSLSIWRSCRFHVKPALSLGCAEFPGVRYRSCRFRFGLAAAPGIPEKQARRCRERHDGWPIIPAAQTPAAG